MPLNPAAARQEVLDLMQRFETEPAHVQQVCRLSLQLFDGLVAVHQLGEPDRFLLETASLLHDIGWATADRGKEHHKESARLIRREKWREFRPDEIELAAQVARYHRKALPSREDHEDFARLEAIDQVRVRKLAGLLRVADALDRSHRQLVASVLCQMEPARITVAIFAFAPIDRELAAVQKKADLARVVFERDILMMPVFPAVHAPQVTAT